MFRNNIIPDTIWRHVKLHSARNCWFKYWIFTKECHKCTNNFTIIAHSAPLKLRPYGAIQMCILLLLLLTVHSAMAAALHHTMTHKQLSLDVCQWQLQITFSDSDKHHPTLWWCFVWGFTYLKTQPHGLVINSWTDLQNNHCIFHAQLVRRKTFRLPNQLLTLCA